MKQKQFCAQNIIEFVFVFLVTMSIFLAIIEMGLYWRAKYCVANIANEIISNVQITAQSTKSQEKTLDKAIETIEKTAGLLNISDTKFNFSGTNGSYVIKSDFQKHGQSALVVFLNINSFKNNDIRVAVAYRYSGLFLYSKGTTITSGVSYSIQKF